MHPYARTATLIKSNNQPEVLTAPSQANAQTTAAGNQVVGWGSLPYFSELDSAGDLQFNAQFPTGVNTYRAYLLPWNPGSTGGGGGGTGGGGSGPAATATVITPLASRPRSARPLVEVGMQAGPRGAQYAAGPVPAVSIESRSRWEPIRTEARRQLGRNRGSVAGARVCICTRCPHTNADSPSRHWRPVRRTGLCHRLQPRFLTTLRLRTPRRSRAGPR